MPALSHLLRRYRRVLGLAQEELAERAQISVRTLGDLERGGSHRPRTETLRLLSAALGLSPTEHAAFMAAARPDEHAPDAREGHAADSRNLPHNLSRPPNSFVGRAAELAAAGAMLQRPTVRILTFVGPPGVGKTRLAVEAAAQWEEQRPGTVVAVSLASLRDADRLNSVIAERLGVRESSREYLTDTLHAHLRDKQLVLLLDNVEQLVTAASHLTDLTDLIAACPHLQLMITSRVTLRIRGEWTFLVSPLALPLPHACESVETLAQVPSVALFIQRAQEIAPDFALTPQNAETIAQICRRLDGLPLAIELAAAWTRLFSPHILLQRLEQRLTLLRGGQRDLPTRQQGLRATLDWSYELLGPVEQAIFRRVSVFVNGCSLEAAEAICSTVTSATGSSPVDYVATLVDHSLMQRDSRPGDDTRLRMLETLREYANEQLEATGDADDTHRAHAAYFAAQAEAAEPYLKGAQQNTWVAGLERDHDNVREALRWALAHREAALALRLAGAMWRFWQVRSYLREGQHWLNQVLTLATRLAEERAEHDQATSSLRAKVLHGAGLLAYYRGELETAKRWNEESLTLRRALADTLGVAQSANNLGLVLTQLGDTTSARERYEESLQLKRQLGDTPGIASTLNNLGWLCSTQGVIAQAVPYYTESLALWRQLGNLAETGRTLANLGQALVRLGDTDAATHLLHESLTVRQRLDDKAGIAHSLALLGDVANAQSQHEKALLHWQRALNAYYDADAQLDGIYCLERLAGAWCRRDQFERAAKLLGAASALRGKFAAPLDDVERPGVERTVAALQTYLDREAFQSLWAEGPHMTFEQAATCGQLVEQPMQEPARERAAHSHDAGAPPERAIDTQAPTKERSRNYRGARPAL